MQAVQFVQKNNFKNKKIFVAREEKLADDEGVGRSLTIAQAPRRLVHLKEGENIVHKTKQSSNEEAFQMPSARR
jgi:hypothetical protein